MQENSTYQQLLNVLTELVDNRSSGSLYIHSNCNHAISFSLNKGSIYAVFFGPKRGLKALPWISSISGGSYRFETMGLSGITHVLPTSHEILNLLRNQEHENGTSAGTAQTRRGTEPGISEQKKSQLILQLKQYLAVYLGPISNMVFDDTLEEAGDFTRSPDRLIDFVNKLCLDIPNEREAEQFKKKAFTAITNILDG
ncbi:MAG: hypothetical protein GY703_22400 [Gammaproteobacteria bacterium]|nr:hypothetical protein [Gammaproteobacteria bacterium]